MSLTAMLPFSAGFLVSAFIGENLAMFAANLGLAASSASLLRTLQTLSSYRDLLYGSVTMVTRCLSEKTQCVLLVPVLKLSVSGRRVRCIKGHQSGAMHRRGNGRGCASRKGARLAKQECFNVEGGSSWRVWKRVQRVDWK